MFQGKRQAKAARGLSFINSSASQRDRTVEIVLNAVLVKADEEGTGRALVGEGAVARMGLPRLTACSIIATEASRSSPAPVRMAGQQERRAHEEEIRDAFIVWAMRPTARLQYASPRSSPRVE